MSVLEIVIVTILLSIVTPFILYTGTKMIRYGYLEATHRFNKDHSRESEDEQGRKDEA